MVLSGLSQATEYRGEGGGDVTGGEDLGYILRDSGSGSSGSSGFTA